MPLIEEAPVQIRVLAKKSVERLAFFVPKNNRGATGMGGRGSGSTSGGASGGLNPGDIVSTTSLISERERHKEEVDATLTVLRDIQEQYGVNLEDAQIATLKGAGRRAMGYYDAGGNLAINVNYFNSERMNSAYDDCVANGFHPSRGSKSGIEAVVAHEMGHRLTDIAGVNAGKGTWQLDSTARDIVSNAAKASGSRSVRKFMAKVSGYAAGDYAEAVAEAFADVYCNKGRAKSASKAIVKELNKYF